MNIADEIALNTMRYHYFSGDNMVGSNVERTFQQRIDPNATEKVGSFITTLPGTLRFVFYHHVRNTKIHIYMDDILTPIDELTGGNNTKDIKVLPFHTYKIFMVNNDSSAHVLGISIDGVTKFNDNTFII